MNTLIAFIDVMAQIFSKKDIITEKTSGCFIITVVQRLLGESVLELACLSSINSAEKDMPLK